MVCLLHANELPLRHLFLALDGCTLGPRQYSGSIGKQLQNCENKSIVSFGAVTGNLPDLPYMVVDKLSTDQKYLYEISQAISVGIFCFELANRQPGKLSHSRWLTQTLCKYT